MCRRLYVEARNDGRSCTAWPTLATLIAHTCRSIPLFSYLDVLRLLYAFCARNVPSGGLLFAVEASEREISGKLCVTPAPLRTTRAFMRFRRRVLCTACAVPF